MIKLPAMTAQLSDESWQKLAEETRCEVNRITNLRNLLNLQDLADIAVACDPQSIIDKMGRTQDTFMNLGERYPALARGVSQQKYSSFAERFGLWDHHDRKRTWSFGSCQNGDGGGWCWEVIKSKHVRAFVQKVGLHGSKMAGSRTGLRGVLHSITRG